MPDPGTTPEAPAAEQRFDLPGVGPCFLPREFAVHTGPLSSVEVRDARQPPATILRLLASDAAVVLTGSYAYADGVLRYCQRFERQLVSRGEIASLGEVPHRPAAFTAARRRRLHRILVAARGNALVGLSDTPDTSGLQEWFDLPTGEDVFLMPLRRLQRILTDMRRAREGLKIEGLPAPITILPHVYVPGDSSVPSMFLAFRHLVEGRTVLDMGTGTGILALLAAQMGAARVVATDISPGAVANARANVERLGLTETVEVRGPADLFGSVEGELFDVILFNAPWIQGDPQTLYDAANYDPGYRVVTEFLRAAPRHLSPDGAILLQYSDVSQRRGEGSLEHLESVLAESGLRVAGSRSISRLSRVLGGRERVSVFEIRRRA